MLVPASHPAGSLALALLEIGRSERALLDAGDLRTLTRFRDEERGADIAAGLGYALLTGEEARTVAQLSWLPAAERLIHDYLRAAAAPRFAELARVTAAAPAGARHGGRPARVHAAGGAGRARSGRRG